MSPSQFNLALAVMYAVVVVVVVAVGVGWHAARATVRAATKPEPTPEPAYVWELRMISEAVRKGQPLPLFTRVPGDKFATEVMRAKILKLLYATPTADEHRRAEEARAKAREEAEAARYVLLSRIEAGVGEIAETIREDRREVERRREERARERQRGVEIIAAAFNARHGRPREPETKPEGPDDGEGTEAEASETEGDPGGPGR